CKSTKNETPVRVDIKSQLGLISGATDSKSLKTKNPQEEGQNQADVQKSKPENVISQPRISIMPSGSSVETHDKASQEMFDHHSTTSGVLETQKQQLNALVNSGISELGSSPSDPFSECLCGKDSILTCTSTGKNLGTKDIQTNQHSGNPLDTNHPGFQDSVSKIHAEVTSGDKYIIKGTAHNLSPNQSTPGSVQRANEDPLPTATDRGSTDSVASHPENTGSEEFSSASLASAPSSDACTNGVTYVNISSDYKTADGESKSVKDYHGDPLGSEDSCIATTCNATQNTEITSNNNNDILGTLSYTFNAMQQNKDNMIKASIPIGVILFLTILLK
ncbi:CYIR protein, partial [Plasmodium cynomolgi strain B]